MDYSDDDMLDASDSELIYDEDLYSEDCADSDGSDADYDFGNKEEVIKQRDERFIVLKEEDIKVRQEENITEVSSILSISREQALVLLRHFKWDASRVNDEWFANEEAVRKSVGLQLETPVQIIETRKIKCGICFEEFPSDKIGDAACGHKYCFSCWQGYIGAAINDGPGSLNLRCPDPSCSVLITQEIINKLAKDEDKEKYARYVVRSYVEDNKKTKWCPSPGCEYAVEFMGNNNYDVFCACSFAFCWNCVEEAHRPVDCNTVAKWILKNCAESENMNWILANSKPCPKCKRPIEKNQGCMHMTCTPPCKFEFCWLCLTAWSEHGERTGGFYACNSYESAKKQGAYDEAERRREMAKNSLEKYTHYYERWASNQTSRVKALGDLNDMKTKKIAELSNNIREPETHLKFIIDAWQQIVECRRVLKWTYAYGYYLPENEVTKRQFFEYLQGEAETALERLHMCAEKELQHFLLIEDPVQKPVEDFGAFRVKLAGLTSVTKNFFENLVRALENGLEDVNSITSTSNQTSTSKNTKGKNGKNNKSSKNGSTGSTRNAVPGVTDDDQWACERCTYANPVTSDTCQMCTQHT